MKQLTAILIGAGDRGNGYTLYMNNYPEKFRIVGVAEPIEIRRTIIKDRHCIPDEACFSDWKDILGKPRMADFAIIATMDDMHYAPAMKAIELGYNLLLEKPVAPTAKECVDIAKAANAKGVSVLVCHVLRYSPFYKTVKSLVKSGIIGEIQSMLQVEAIGNMHFSNSYIRGNWHSEEESSSMLLAKSCHDIDILQWILEKTCKRVQSFGSLSYFLEKNAPIGAPSRCIDGCPAGNTCPYNSKKYYYDDPENIWRKAVTKTTAESETPTNEEVMEALRTTDYGLCVFRANNDVVDRQTVNMEFENGVTVCFMVNPFNRGGRFIRIFGSKGELVAYMADEKISVYTFEDKLYHEYLVKRTDESIRGGHGGGDRGIVVDLYDYLNGTYTGDSVADINVSVSNHMIVFAAEESRKNGTVVSMDDIFKKYSYKSYT